MRKISTLLACAALLAVLTVTAGTDAGTPADRSWPPFQLGQENSPAADTVPGGQVTFEPKNPYNIFINYELGMHCVGFNISYCCIIPPYNSIQAQAVRSGVHGSRPVLLSPDDGVRLRYWVRDNTYSEGNKMIYWGARKEVNPSGASRGSGDNMANYVWTHLFIYQDLEGTRPADARESVRLHIGREIPVNIDAGPSGKGMAGGEMTYAGSRGGNIVFTDSLLAELTDIPLTLTSAYLWDALGLPLTAFNDSRRRGSIRTITDRDFQPYQASVVTLTDSAGKAVGAAGRPAEFFGTNPVDIADCSLCHAGGGLAAVLARQEGLRQVDREYEYWKQNYPDNSDYTARLMAAIINILELHDRRHQTRFLADYNSRASSNRLGKVEAVNCVDCHGDNMSGNLQTPRPRVTGYTARRGKPLTEAIHGVHARYIPMPDKAGRTQSCQTCHPSHWQNEAMNEPGKNPHAITDAEGRPRFTNADLRVSGGGCYLRRDAHANPHVTPPFFLNDIGKWHLKNVSRVDESGRAVKEIRGLYCTNCHNSLAHELYRRDEFVDAVVQKGKTLRGSSVPEVLRALGVNEARFKNYFADPTVGVPGDPLTAYYSRHESAVLMKQTAGPGGKPAFAPWNSAAGEALSYATVSGGSDWWLSAAAPHCADCHVAPFVESPGGAYFPIDQPGKYALYRYSKAHGRLACQSCHESMHGLYPVRYEGPAGTVDLTSHQQALQFSPNGKYAGPVTCAACHSVNARGVPVQLAGTPYAGDYWASVVLIHFMREGDPALSVPLLIKKYPYANARAIVAKGWE